MHFNGPDNANTQRRYLVPHAVTLGSNCEFDSNLPFFKIDKDDSGLW